MNGRQIKLTEDPNDVNTIARMVADLPWRCRGCMENLEKGKEERFPTEDGSTPPFHNVNCYRAYLRERLEILSNLRASVLKLLGGTALDRERLNAIDTLRSHSVTVGKWKVSVSDTDGQIGLSVEDKDKLHRFYSTGGKRVLEKLDRPSSHRKIHNKEMFTE